MCLVFVRTILSCTNKSNQLTIRIMETSKFKVGDRVAVYLPSIPPLPAGRTVGTVTRIATDETLALVCDGWSGMAHPRQCRKLIPKKRMRVWVRKEYVAKCLSGEPFSHIGPIFSHTVQPDRLSWSEFIEVKEPKGDK